MTSSVKKGTGKRVMHPHSLANLRPPRWKPGEAGNPNGLSLKTRLRVMLERQLLAGGELPPLPPDAIVADKFVRSTLEKGIEGVPAQFKEIWDRIDGKQADTTVIIGGEHRDTIINILADPGAREAGFALLRALEAGASGNGGAVESGRVAANEAPKLPQPKTK